MARGTPRILYLAVADARGHLMRAHLVRRALAEAGVAVDVVTTSAEGVDFLARLGTPSLRISDGFRVEFGERHDLCARRTDLRVASYVFRPSRGLRDLRTLEALARGAAFVVDDSLHPALLAAPLVGSRLRVVHVYGENLWAAAVANFRGRAPRWASHAFERALCAARDRAFGRIVHRVELPESLRRDGPRTYSLTPLIAPPQRSREAVRAALGLGAQERLAAVYLNPHFRDGAFAEALERATAAEGFHLDGISEAFAGRPGWRAADPAFTDLVAAADVFVSGAGMAALAQARATGTPLVSLLGAQPEQVRNVEAFSACGHPFEAVRIGPELEEALREALRGLSAVQRAPADAGATATAQAWRDTFLELIHAAEEEVAHEAGHRVDPGDEQPEGRGRPRRSHRGEPRSPLAAARAADAAAG